jgi:DNA invertase Pin-like site-specific DNA recombinase
MLAQENHRITAAPLRAARWVRVSTEEQGKEGHAGVARQIDTTNRIIAARGYDLVESFTVVDVGGSSVEQSPEFQRLLCLIKSGVQVVCVSEISRLIRPDSLQSLAVLDIFARHHCLIIAGDMTIDFSNPEGFLTGGLHALMAGHEKMALLRKVTAAKEINRRRGFLASSYKTLPLGVSYDKATRKFFYNDDICRVVEAYMLLDEKRCSLSEIGRRIGVTPTTVKNLLQNEIFIGYRVYKDKRDLSVKRMGSNGRQGWRPKLRRSPEEIIRIRVIEEPAISPERFARVQNTLVTRRFNYTETHQHRHVNLGTGVAHCFCGEPLQVVANGKPRKDGSKPATGYYCCKSHHPVYGKKLQKCGNTWVRREGLDALIVAFCQRILANEQVLSSIIKSSVSHQTEVVRPFPVQSKADAISKLEARDARLIQMCSMQTITIQELREQRAKLHAEIARLRELGGDQSPPVKAELGIEQMARLLVRGALGFSRIKERQAQKVILEGLFRRVFFRRESVIAFQFADELLACVKDIPCMASGIVDLPAPFRIVEEVPDGHKKCSFCKKIFPSCEFFHRKSQCKPCLRRLSRDYRKARKLKAASA